jgi:ribosomal protein L7/L12
MPDLNDEILALLAAGNKIQAIKRFREETGTGLAEAKSAVEAIERGIRVEVPQRVDPKSLTPEQLMQEVLALVKQNRYLWAIKTYGEATGSQLQESKAQVDRLMRANGLEPPKSGCGGVISVLVFLLCGGIAAYLMFAK